MLLDIKVCPKYQAKQDKNTGQDDAHPSNYFHKFTVQKIQAYQLRLSQSHAGDRQAIENMTEFQ